MKNFLKIILIIFVIVTIITLKDDVIGLFQDGGVKGSSDRATIEDPGESEFSLPGPLRVFNALFTGGSHTKPLTISGIIIASNIARSDNGNLAALTENALLDISAQKKLDDMFSGQYFEHVSPTGVTLGDVIETVDYDYIVVGENLALGDFKDDESVVKAWMESPGHRANILNPHYTDIGVAVGQGMFEGRKTWIAVQHFGRPASACPIIDKDKKALIEKKEKEISLLEKDINEKKEHLDTSDHEAVEAYNGEVAHYNELIAEIKKETSAYNLSVRQYNNCVSKS